MTHRIMAATMALSVSLITAPALMAAPVSGFRAPTPAAKLDSGKIVSFQLRNDSKEAVTVKAGDQELTIQPGKTSGVKTADGTQIISVNATSTHTAGEVLAVASANLTGATLVIK
jgi:hypothetical protein